MIGWKRARFYYGSPARAASRFGFAWSSPNSSAGKYTEGELGEDRSFYFRGPDGALSLRVQNLSLFLQIAAGVDDRTWLYHLRAGDYSARIRGAIKDEDLADEVAAVEHDRDLSAADSRARIKEAIDRRYTGPTSESPGPA
jgi:hypothetical protein